MRIMYITDALAIWGGVERILVDKVNYLADYYHEEIMIVTVNQGEHPIVYPLSKNVICEDLGVLFQQIYKFHGLKRIIKKWQLKNRYIDGLRKVVEDFCPDIIVSVRIRLTHGVIQAKGSVPLVFESHSSYKGHLTINKSLFARFRNYLECRDVKSVQHVVCLTEGDASVWRKINSKTIVIPNLVHLYQGSDYATCEEKSIIFVGRFSKQKDIKSLLDIWMIVYKQHPDWQLHIYGGYGEDQDVLLPTIERMKENVRFFSPTADIMNRYLRSSILVMTSVYEPFGLVLPEAMSCGLPVVAFDCPYGPAEIISDGKDGFLIKGRNLQQFAEKVCLLIENPDLRLRMGQAGVWSSKRYRAEVIMPQWKTLFEEVVEHGTF